MIPTEFFALHRPNSIVTKKIVITAFYETRLAPLFCSVFNGYADIVMTPHQSTLPQYETVRLIILFESAVQESFTSIRLFKILL